MHTLALAELEVCETDPLSAGGLGPRHHFLQTENRGSSQLKSGWDNNEPSSRHRHLVSGIIETFRLSRFFCMQLRDKTMRRVIVQKAAHSLKIRLIIQHFKI